ncbi:helix-turn-helix domain-containing protein [Kocuria rhizophila]|uniref:AlbA family DNA-binding domain-containing protein n=1 Tax=Kocuria TaxID=57493 RepID=UPI0022F13B7B|nr:ATP-binding protein [Kocuria rhizophila]MDA4827485.1 ATP-binding protein [Kocuria rhizophila]
MFTPIHRALGLKPGDITWDLIECAVEQKVEEAVDLDWKQCDYLDSRNPQWQDEVAKDIAAMANSGGGWIVLGVAEDRAISAAAEITPSPGMPSLSRRSGRLPTLVLVRQ